MDVEHGIMKMNIEAKILRHANFIRVLIVVLMLIYMFCLGLLQKNTTC